MDRTLGKIVKISLVLSVIIAIIWEAINIIIDML